MNLLLIVSLLFVAAVGTAVVLSRKAEAQAVTLSAYGLVLALFFVLVQAPDVALSQFAVGSAVVPLMVLLTVRTVRREDGDK